MINAKPLKTPADLEQTLARLQNDLAEVNTGAKYIIRALLDNDRSEKALRLAREFLGLPADSHLGSDEGDVLGPGLMVGGGDMRIWHDVKVMTPEESDRALGVAAGRSSRPTASAEPVDLMAALKASHGLPDNEKGER